VVSELNKGVLGRINKHPWTRT